MDCTEHIESAPYTVSLSECRTLNYRILWADLGHVLLVSVIGAILLFLFIPNDQTTFALEIIMLSIPILLMLRVEYWLRLAKKLLEDTQIATITNESVGLRDSTGNSRVITWSTLVKARFQWGYLVLYVTKRSRVVLPLRAFSSEQVSQMSELVREKGLLR